MRIADRSCPGGAGQGEVEREGDYGEGSADSHRVGRAVGERVEGGVRSAGEVERAEQHRRDDSDPDRTPDALGGTDDATGRACFCRVDPGDDEVHVRRDEQPAAGARNRRGGSRAIAPDLIAKAESPWPTSRSQEKKWSKTIRQRLASLVNEKLAPELASALAEKGLPAKTRTEGEQIFIDYEALGQGTGYVLPSVLLEFGARSTGEPKEPRQVQCDAAQ